MAKYANCTDQYRSALRKAYCQRLTNLKTALPPLIEFYNVERTALIPIVYDEELFYDLIDEMEQNYHMNRANVDERLDYMRNELRVCREFENAINS